MGRFRLAIVRARLDMFKERLDARLDSFEHRLRIHTCEDDHRDERREEQAFTSGEFLERRVRLVGLAVEHALIGPQQVERGEDDADRCDDDPPAGRRECTNQNEELTDEAIEPGQADRGQHDDREEPGKHRSDGLDSLQLCDGASVATLVDHADHEEERPGRDAVVDVLHHSAGDGL